MDPSQQPPYTPPKREILLQGPRPAPLKVSKDSFKIKKPPKHPQPHHQPPAPVPVPSNQPVIIYSVSPKPYFVEPSDFRSLVQHLTGRGAPSPVNSTGSEPPVSPAARLAAMERTSPKEREWRRSDVGMSMTVVGEAEIDMMSQMPGILSPAPSNLPVISSTMFSPAAGTVAGDGHGFFGMSELMSPFMSNMAFLPSPQSLFFSNTPIVSPSPNGEFFNIFDF
ncbi:protein MKS1-like [Silene latifolia]|uniref:protein MKS1-like n=1 Tax=Silene latifolia TaxID=37657 RepID=UPI003D77A2EC